MQRYLRDKNVKQQPGTKHKFEASIFLKSKHYKNG